MSYRTQLHFYNMRRRSIAYGKLKCMVTTLLSNKNKLSSQRLVDQNKCNYNGNKCVLLSCRCNSCIQLYLTNIIEIKS